MCIYSCFLFPTITLHFEPSRTDNILKIWTLKGLKTYSLMLQNNIRIPLQTFSTKQCLEMFANMKSPLKITKLSKIFFLGF